MFEKCFYAEGLAHASYLFGADGEATGLLSNATSPAVGLKIVAIFNIHPHAGFVSGHLELA